MVDQGCLPQEANASLFPYRLYEMLEECESRGKSHVVSWFPDGKAFKVHLVPEFVATILPVYFRQSKYKSFQRQCEYFRKEWLYFFHGRMLSPCYGILLLRCNLVVQVNLWGFERVTSSGPEKGAYYHKHFLKGNHTMVKLLTRQRGNKTTDSSLQSPQKSTKPKHQKLKKTRTGQRRVRNLCDGEMASKSPWNHDNATKIGRQEGQMNEIVSGKGITSMVVEVTNGHPLRNDAMEIVSLDTANNSQRKLLFEGCEFFPLEEECYDELEEIILQSGTDLLNWSRFYNDSEQSIMAPSIPSNHLALPPPPSQLCRV